MRNKILYQVMDQLWDWFRKERDENGLTTPLCISLHEAYLQLSILVTK